MIGTPRPDRVFSEARRAAQDRAQLAGLTGAQCDDLSRALLDLEAYKRVDENIAARLARQGVPVSRLLRLHPRASLIGVLRECEPGALEILGLRLAQRMAAGDWQIASGNAGRTPYPSSR